MMDIMDVVKALEVGPGPTSPTNLPILHAPVTCTRTHGTYRSHMRVHLHPQSHYTYVHTLTHAAHPATLTSPGSLLVTPASE